MVAAATMGSAPDQLRPHRRARAPRAAFTLIEALVASVIVAMVALAASTSVAVGIAVEEENRRAVLATQVAELRMSEVLERPFGDMASLAGTAAGESLGSPPVPGSGTRVPLPLAASGFTVVTSVETENRSFPRLNNFVLEGRRITVEVRGADGAALARLVRFRGKDPQT
jgi:prepilin-type N-terminal cleavage/methylation domain-containing protein